MDAPRSAGPRDVDPGAWARLERLERFAHGLDSRFRIPGTGIRFGWDSIIGLVPGIGDVAALGPGAYIWLEGHRLGVPGHLKAQMALNLGLDWAIGSIPVVGDLFDVGFKANRRNVALIRGHLERSGGRAAMRTAPDPAPRPHRATRG